MSDDYDALLGHLMALPAVDPERNKLRDVVKGSADSLARRARRFLTLGAVYAERERYAKTRDVIPTYYQWLTSKGFSAAEAKRESERARAEWATINARTE